jgi:hypothetical protein
MSASTSSLQEELKSAGIILERTGQLELHVGYLGESVKTLGGYE